MNILSYMALAAATLVASTTTSSSAPQADVAAMSRQPVLQVVAQLSKISEMRLVQYDTIGDTTKARSDSVVQMYWEKIRASYNTDIDDPSRNFSRHAMDTTTDTTAAIWRQCEYLARMVSKKLHKKLAYNDLLDFNAKTYPCVRDYAVYQVKAGDFVTMFRTDTSSRDSVSTRNEEGYYSLSRSDGSPDLGAKEFDSLKADSRAHLPSLRKGRKPLVVLNGTPIPYSTTIDLDHIWGDPGLEVMTAASYIKAHDRDPKSYPDPKDWNIANGIIFIRYTAGW